MPLIFFSLNFVAINNTNFIFFRTSKKICVFYISFSLLTIYADNPKISTILCCQKSARFGMKLAKEVAGRKRDKASFNQSLT